MRNLIFGSIVLLVASCQPDVELSPVPTLEFVSISPSTAVEFVDSITFVIKYRDNDGDLGENDAQVQNLFLTDTRIGIVYPYRISQLAPDGANVPIEGNIKVVLPNTGMIDDDADSETVRYAIYVVDRAGNQSGTVTSSAITIVRN